MNSGGPKVGFVSLGCPKNLVDTEVMMGRLRADGHELTPEPGEADVIVALGGDGFMLETLHAHLNDGVPIYGMNRGSVGFLMNPFTTEDLLERIRRAECAVLHPLRMVAHLDAEALSAVSEIVEALIVEDRPEVLDLMASWDSHLGGVTPGRLVGLGLNRDSSAVRHLYIRLPQWSRKARIEGN